MSHAIRSTLAAWVALALAVTLLQGCGFALRGAPNYVFETVAVTPERSGGVAAELSRLLGSRVRPATTPQGAIPPDAMVEVLSETRQKVVVGLNAAGLCASLSCAWRCAFRYARPKARS